MKHKLTDEVCYPGVDGTEPNRHSGVCRRCAWCKKWLPESEWETNCPGPDAPQQQADPAPDEVRRALEESTHFIKSPASLRLIHSAARCWLRDREQPHGCSFCGQVLVDTRYWTPDKRACICDECVRGLAADDREQQPGMTIEQVIAACGAHDLHIERAGGNWDVTVGCVAHKVAATPEAALQALGREAVEKLRADVAEKQARLREIGCE